MNKKNVRLMIVTVVVLVLIGGIVWKQYPAIQGKISDWKTSRQMTQTASCFNKMTSYATVIGYSYNKESGVTVFSMALTFIDKSESQVAYVGVHQALFACLQRYSWGEGVFVIYVGLKPITTIDDGETHFYGTALGMIELSEDAILMINPTGSDIENQINIMFAEGDAMWIPAYWLEGVDFPQNGDVKLALKRMKQAAQKYLKDASGK